MNRLYLSGLTLATGLAIASFAPPIKEAQAQSCTPLTAVGSSSTEIEKTVSPPGTGVTQDNWNTDFIVPTDTSYSSYRVVVNSMSNGEYDIELNLKYPDDTADEAYSAFSYSLNEEEMITLSAEPRPTEDPYQVNIQVGGVLALGDTYTVAAYGCV